MEPVLPSAPRCEIQQCKTNFFRLKSNENIFCYRIAITPDLPENKVSVMNKIIYLGKKHIAALLPVHIINHNRLFSTTLLENEESIIVSFEDRDYKLKLNFLGDLRESDSEYQNFLGRFFKLLQNKLSLKLIGRKYFDSENRKPFPALRLEIWPGFSTSLKKYKENILMNIDASYKVLREETVLDHIEEMRKLGLTPDKVEEKLMNSTVMTRYNRRLYQIKGVDWNITPRSTFNPNGKLKEGRPITYYQYYDMKYGHKIKEPDQPMLKIQERKNSSQVIYLVPEFCCQTGLSDAQRANHNLMKEISTITKPDPQKRMDESLKLIKKINETKESHKILSDWGLTLSDSPEDISSIRLEAGSIVLGKKVEAGPERYQFHLELPDLERKTQLPMFQQPDLQKWAIFCSAADSETCKTLLETLKQSVDLYKYQAQMPKIFHVRSKNWPDWERELRSLDSSVQAVVALLPGARKMAPLYAQVKSLLVSSYPIPSQVVLTKTIENGKNLKSICNKILVQICAKLGGIPWAISDMPFSEKPTMVIGMDVYHKPETKRPSVLALCATMDRFFCKYWSTYKVVNSSQPVANTLQPTICDAFNEFKAQNKVYPLNIIVYREGVAETMRKSIEEMEVTSFRRAFESMGIAPKLIFITVTKGIAAKFFLGDSLKRNLSNPPAGSLFREKITDGFDFYLISQKAAQGTATPSHYYILVNDYEDAPPPPASQGAPLSPRVPHTPSTVKIHCLSYKLCYMYYNWLGSIKIPAPIQYAHKLAGLVGDKLGNKVKPSDEFAKKRSLYFI